MLVREVLAEIQMVWARQGGKQVRKYRCTSGHRKGRVMASPASCTRPINVSRSLKLKKTKAAKAGKISMTGVRTRRSVPTSVRLKSLNKPKSRRGRSGRI